MISKKQSKKIIFLFAILMTSVFVCKDAGAAGLQVGNTTLNLVAGENLYYGVTSPTNSAGNFLLFEKGAGNVIFRIDNAGNITSNGSLVGSNSYWNLSGSNLFASSTSWNLGIGTNNPVQKLDVNGVINSATGFRIANVAVSGSYLRGNGTNFVSSAIQPSDLPTNVYNLGMTYGFHQYGYAIGDGWYKIAETTLNSNCSGSNLIGDYQDLGYTTAARYSFNISSRAECDFTTNNESHDIDWNYQVSSTYNLNNIDSKFRIVRTVNNANSITYELQVNVETWNTGAWTFRTSGSWTIYNSPQTAGVPITSPAPRVYKFSNLNVYDGRLLAGTIGIGSAVPATKLDVAGGGQFTLPVSVGTPTAASHAVTKSYLESSIGSPVSSGTTGQTLRHNGTSWIANSLLYNNGTNVGIGTTNPVYKLQVAGEAFAGNGFRVSSTNGDNVNGAPWYGLGQSTLNLYDASHLAVQVAGYWGLNFQTMAGNMVIRGDTGNVGIGSTIPAAKLDVTGGGRFTNPVVVGTPTDTSHATTKSYVDGAVSSVNANLLDNIDSPRFVFGSNGSGSNGASATQNVYEMAQYKSGFWDTNASPWAPTTDWYWGATFAHQSNSASYNYSGQLAFRNGGGGNTVYARTINGGTPTVWSRLLSDTSNVNSSGNLLISGTGAHYISAGNFGVGSTVPSAKLDVAGGGQFTLPVTVATPTIGSHATTKSYVDGLVPDAGTSGQTLRNDGTRWRASSIIYNNGTNVGVGTTAPSASLDIAGKVKITSGGTIYNTDSARWLDMTGTLTDSLRVSGNLITTAGSVGVGTTGPAAKLQVLGNAKIGSNNAQGLWVDSTGGADYGTQLYLTQDLGSVQGAIKIATDYSLGGGNISPNFVISRSTNTQAYTSNPNSLTYSPVFVIDRTGNVGIGTTNPGTYKLYVNDSAYINGSLTLASGANITMPGTSQLTVNKLQVNTIDPLYNIKGVNYSTFAASIVGGVKEEISGKIEISKKVADEYQAIIDFDKEKIGSDLWVWRSVIDFSEDNVEAIITPYGSFAKTYYSIDNNKFIFHSDIPVKVSYRLLAKRFDWKQWPTKAKNQKEKAGFILK